MSTNDAQSLAAVVVNHDDGPAVLAQFRAYAVDDPERFRAVRWLLIHNGPDEPPTLADPDPQIQSDLQRIEILHTRNEGYGRAANRALRSTDSEYLLILNADLLPKPGFLAGLCEVVDELQRSKEKIGVVGFRLLNPDGSPQGSAGRFPNLGRVLLGLLRPRATRKYLHPPTDRPSSAPWLTGACMLVARACIERIGPFDERYFMYYEDVDLCRRAWTGGWRVRFEPRIAMTHFHPYHARPLTHEMVCYARHGLLTYFWKHRSTFERKILEQIIDLECRYRRRSGIAGDREGWSRVADMLDRFRQAPGVYLPEPDAFT